MSAASDLIERMERDAGCRIDDNGHDNNAMAGLFGALSRIMGQSPVSYKEKDDMAAGILIKHQMTPEYKRHKESERMMVDMLLSGMSPDDLKIFLK